MRMVIFMALFMALSAMFTSSPLCFNQMCRQHIQQGLSEIGETWQRQTLQFPIEEGYRMTIPALKTKLLIPCVAPTAISRVRLQRKLNFLYSHPLTLISAPAGFGKTTLMASWSRQVQLEQIDVAWLSLDRDDNEPRRFWLYMAAALEQVAPTIGAEMGKMLTSEPTQPIEAVLTHLINLLAAQSQPIVLVLDDYHFVQEPAIHDALTYLIEYMPEVLHLVLVARCDPALPLARWRVRQRLLEVRTNDLRFTTEEIGLFLNQRLSSPLTLAQIGELERRTEGWIAGLQLAVLLLKESHNVDQSLAQFTGTNHYVLDYLVDEVLRQQPPELQRFLQQTSILTHLTPALCNWLTNRNDSEALLHQLERQNLFLSRTAPVQTEMAHPNRLRYHPLFAQMLRSHLNADLCELHLRASQWYEEHGLWSEALVHAQQSNQPERVVKVMQQLAKVDKRAANSSGTGQDTFTWTTSQPARISHHDAHPSYQVRQPLIEPPLIEPLSARELEVLSLLASGNSNQRIADTLIIASGTVKRHVSNIMGKLGAENRTGAVMRAQELGLLM